MLICVLPPGCASASKPAPPPWSVVIEPERLASELAAAPPDLVVLDVRGTAAYDSGHVPGAVQVDPEQWQKASFAPATGLRERAVWERRIGDLGVSGAERIVIYDDGRMTEAARVWFILQYYGVPRAAVLNGGLRAFAALPEERRGALSRQPATPAPKSFAPPPTSAAVALVERDWLRENLSSRSEQIWDARTPAEFAGTDARGNPRTGHLPGSVNLSHTELMDASGKLRPAPEIARLLEAAGFDARRPILTHCQAGGRSSLAALAAVYAGYGPVENYYLSFGDWAADATCPLAGPQP